MALNRSAWFAQGFIGLWLMASGSVQAQIAPDGTLGAERSRLTPISPNTERIDGGAIRGSNLFHSFQEFSIGEGRGAYFANPTGVDNILSRVTGRNPSNIFGTLGVLGNANLYLLNPNGIFFGPNARLDIRGSFTASTADSIVFSDRSLYSATDTQTRPLLTVAVSIGLQYGGQQAGGISNAGNLAVGQDLSLVAGNLDLQGQLRAGRDLTLQAAETVRVRDSLTVPFVAQAGRNLTIQGNQGIDILALSHPGTPFQSGSDITLTSNGTISGDAHFASGKNFSIRNLTGAPGSLVSLYDPIISATGDVVFDNYTGASLKIEATGSITGGNITITQPDDQLTGSDPDIPTLASQSALILRAGNVLSNPPAIPRFEGGASFTPDNNQPLPGSINVGNIDITSPAGIDRFVSLSAPGNITTGFIQTAVFNTEIGGVVGITSQNGSINITAFNDNQNQDSIIARSVTINAPGTLRILGFINARTDIPERAGDVKIGESIRPTSVSLAGISARNLFDDINASGGTILVKTTGIFEATGAFSPIDGLPVAPNSEGAISLASQATGDGGRLEIDADGGIITAAGIRSSSSLGIGGGVTLLSSGNISTGFISTANNNFRNVANIDITSRSGSISINQSEGTDDSIFGKDLTINAPGSLFIKGFINSRADSLGTINLTIGNELKPSSIILAGISTRNRGGGSGGNISIATTGLLNVTGATTRNSGVTVQPNEPIDNSFSIGSEASANGVSINIIADGGIQTRAGIVSNSQLFGNGGDITLKSSNGAITIPGVIDASSHLAFFGNGGNISLEAGGDITTGTVESIGQRGGQIILNSGGNLSITENDVVSITTGQGRGGDIGLAARAITLTDTRVANLTFGDGRAGDIIVKASESVNILNQGSSSPRAIGSFPLRELKRQAADLKFEGSGIVSTTGSTPGRTAMGNTGDITVETKRLLIQAAPGLTESRLAGISTATLQSSSGDSGSITVNAAESINILGNYFDPFIPGVFDAKTARETAAQVRDIRTGITSATQGTGNAGGITIRTGQLSLRQGAAITSGITDEGTGNGGNLTINATSVDLEGKAALATGTLGSIGKAGDLTINADRITLRDGALISADKLGTGLAGSVTINAGELLLTNRSRIGSSALISGRGGDLTLTIARSIQMKNIGDPQNATEIASNAFDDANGGNISILVGGQIRAKKGENNDIVATTERGRGGIVNVQAGGLIDFFINLNGLRTPENELSAASLQGINGVVNQNGNATQQPPPTQPVVRDLPQVCPQGVTTRQAGRSEFMNTGRGGLPPNPGEALESNVAQVPWVTLDLDEQKPSSATTSRSSDTVTLEVIEEAEGWVRLPNGRVFLTTETPTAFRNPCLLRSSQP